MAGNIKSAAGSKSKRAGVEKARVGTLTDFERQLIALACEGLRDREIGGRLNISERAARDHLAAIMRKLDVLDRVELIIYAHCNNLSEKRTPHN